jgi:hypothetical protein
LWESFCERICLPGAIVTKAKTVEFLRDGWEKLSVSTMRRAYELYTYELYTADDDHEDEPCVRFTWSAVEDEAFDFDFSWDLLPEKGPESTDE